MCASSSDEVLPTVSGSVHELDGHDVLSIHRKSTIKVEIEATRAVNDLPGLIEDRLTIGAYRG